MQKPHRCSRQSVVVRLLEELQKRGAVVKVNPPGSVADYEVTTSTGGVVRLRAVVAMLNTRKSGYAVDCARYHKKKRLPFCPEQVDLLATFAGSHCFFFRVRPGMPLKVVVHPGCHPYRVRKPDEGDDAWDWIDKKLFTKEESVRVNYRRSVLGQKEPSIKDYPIDLDAMMQEPWNEDPPPRKPFPEIRR